MPLPSQVAEDGSGIQLVFRLSQRLPVQINNRVGADDQALFDLLIFPNRSGFPFSQLSGDCLRGQKPGFF
jgi:hypothetical protein